MTTADVEPLWPKAPSRRRPGRSTYASLHRAYHRLTRRLVRELFPWQLSPAEGLILLAIRINSPAPVWMVRRDTGLRGSTLSSMLERLETRGLLARKRAPDDPRAVEVTLTPEGKHLAEVAAATFDEIDIELATFTSPADRAGVDAVDEASAAMTPGRAPLDY